jgi:hypothetical protein
MKDKDLEEEVSHWPPVTIYHNLFNDINIDINLKPFVQWKIMQQTMNL